MSIIDNSEYMMDSDEEYINMQHGGEGDFVLSGYGALAEDAERIFKESGGKGT